MIPILRWRAALAFPLVLGTVLPATALAGHGQVSVRSGADRHGPTTVLLSPAAKAHTTAVPRPTPGPKPTRTPRPTATPLPNNLTVTTTKDVATCPAGPGNQGYSLRCALTQLNQSGGPRTVSFAIPSSDPGCSSQSLGGQATVVCTITVTKALPAIKVNGSTIDGYTQPGAARGTVFPGSNARLAVSLATSEVVGSGLSLIGASNVTISGLAITGFSTGISVRTGPHAAVEGNYIGVTPEGTAAGDQVGISVSNSPDTVLGGPDDGSGNVISGNKGDGIALSSSDAVTVEGNSIGPAPSAASSFPNDGDGIALQASTGVTIGVLGHGNVIRENKGYGIWVSRGGTREMIAGNEVVNNRRAGVFLGAATSRAVITRNVIAGNRSFDIQLGPSGKSACAVATRQSSGYARCPVISQLTNHQAAGTACKRCRVELYVAEPTKANRGFGGGQKYLGTAKASAQGTWRFNLTRTGFRFGRQELTAIALTGSASSRSGTTSEFSLDMPVAIRLRDFAVRPEIAVHTGRRGVRKCRHARHAKVCHTITTKVVTRRKVGMLVTWAMASQQAVTGFSVYGASRKLDPRIIPVNARRDYRYRVRWTGTGPVRLTAILADGTSRLLGIRKA